MWRAINTLTKGRSLVNNNLLSELTPDVFNAHIVFVVSKFLPDDQTEASQYSCSNKLLNFCSVRTSQNDTFSIPPISVSEVGICISKMDNNQQAVMVILLNFKKLPFLAELKHLHIHMYIYNMHTKDSFPNCIQER